MKILVIEDEKELAESIVQYLTSTDYRCEVAFDYSSGSEKISLYHYDCVLLDITMPGGNGLDLLRALKGRNKKEGVIIISAKNSLDDKIEGLDIGADDYLAKPFHLAELGARIKALIRRNHFEGSNVVQVDHLTLDMESKTAKVLDRKIELTKSEFELLVFLISNKNRVIAKDAIGEHLTGDDADRFNSYDFIYSHVKNLKRKLAEAGSPDYIKTIYGLGYKFET
jgi:DNA-binding response OmpR family regulator